VSEQDERQVPFAEAEPSSRPEEPAAASADGWPRQDGTSEPWPGEKPFSEPPPPQPPFSWPLPPPGASIPSRPEPHQHPLDKVTGRLPPNVRVVVDWVVTIVGAIAIVLAVKAWVVNPYRIPSSSMEPTLHCARPATGCLARFSDRVLANRFIYHFENPARGDIVVFRTPPEAKIKCGEGGTFVKRIIGLPGERVQIRLIHGAGYVYINGRKLDEPYIQHDRRDIGPAKTYLVPKNSYFMMGDNRASSCDSRQWGSVPRGNLIGKVFMTYWPPNRISFR
jgi:signal peptidase I